MKKVIVLAAILAVISSAALAEIDISSLSFSELYALRDQCQLEMAKRDEWQEVTVPPGVYQVGVHIPAGTWTVVCRTGISSDIEWGETLAANGHEIDLDESERYHYERVYNPGYKDYKKYYDGSLTQYTFTVRDGDWIIIDGRDIVFIPGSLTPSFSFK